MPNVFVNDRLFQQLQQVAQQKQLDAEQFLESMLDSAFHQAALPQQQADIQTQLLDAIGQSVIAADLNGNVIYWNRMAETLYGWSRDEAMGRNAIEMLVSAQHHDDAVKTVSHVLAGGSLDGEYWVQRRDGRDFPVRATSALLYNPAGEPVGMAGISTDISEQFQNARQLEASEQRYRTLFENSPVSLWEEDFSSVQAYLDKLTEHGIVDFPAYFTAHPEEVEKHIATMKVLDVNQASLAMYKAKSKEELMAGFPHNILPDDLTLSWTPVVPIGHATALFAGESVNRTMTGELLDVFISLNMLPSYEGSLTRALVCVIDITEAKRAHQELNCYREYLEEIIQQRTAELNHVKERVEAILNSSSDAILLLGADGRIEKTNSAFDKLFACKPDAAFDKPFQSFLHRESETQLTAAINACTDGNMTPPVEVRALHHDGTEFDAEIALAPVITGASDRKGFICSLRDVSERKHTVKALRESEARFRSFFEQPLIGLAITSPDKGIVMINDKLCEMLGYSQEELLQISWDSLTHPDDLASDLALFDQVMAGELEGYSLDKRLVHKDGHAFQVFKTCRCVRDPQGNVTYFVSMLQDISERKQLEMNLRRSLQREQELGALKSRFVSMVSHEFRNPLASIMTSSDILKRFSDRIDEERKQEHLDRIQLQVRHLTDLMEDILTMNKAQTVGIECNPVGVDLEMLCLDIISNMQLIHPNHQIEFSRRYGSTFVWLDPKLIRQAITNLMSNAIKYSPSGSAVQLDLSCTNRQIQISVHDQGIGIPEIDQQHLFETFYRASNVSDIAGTGLGLAIVKQAAEAHHGTVSFESHVGVGTTFTITIPLVEPEGLHVTA